MAERPFGSVLENPTKLWDGVTDLAEAWRHVFLPGKEKPEMHDLAEFTAGVGDAEKSIEAVRRWMAAQIPIAEPEPPAWEPSHREIL